MHSSSKPGTVLPYDVIEQIFEHTEDSLATLVSCCLLNREMNQAASSALYKTLDLEIGVYAGPGRRRWRRQGNRHADIQTHANQAFSSACLPHNRHRVKKIVLRGAFDYLDIQSTSVQLRAYIGTFFQTDLQAHLIVDAFQLFDNIESITFNLTSWWDHEGVGDQVTPHHLLQALYTLKQRGLIGNLRELTLNSHLCETADQLKHILHPNLRKLALIDIREPAFDWAGTLERCSELTELHIRGDFYTSYSPGSFSIDSIERALKPLRGLRSLTLGLVMTSKNDQIFDMLSRLPQLEDLCLEYQFPWFCTLKLPATFSPLRTLKSFTLRYKELNEDAINHRTVDICKWIKHVVSLSPLERLSYRPFYQPRTHNPKPKESWDILIDHLADKHARTLRALDLRAGFVRKRGLRRLLVNCQQLEELSIATSRGALQTTFVQYAHKTPELVHGQFELRTQCKNRQEQARITELEEAEHILKAAPGLRRLQVNDVEFLGSWALDEHGTLGYVVKKKYL
ncbi:hypothetical protein VNI00_003803 [Paramarasmius palmivorus]|uniref:F-box domain-containing protein n=1 Tax=Paramarasmius palmivorus TaxID=297713 RepID=A0AAW0DP69_9AGAR